jgi:photosystem II stability/assembly factor-like uncharacterized protein
MIYIGTDEGIYRWFRGAPWPIYHSLQDRAVVSLASPGAGLLVAVDGAGRVLESVNNGMDWREVGVPERIGRPVAVALGATPGSVLLTTRPLGLFRRSVGSPVPSPSEESSWAGPALLKDLLARARRGGGSSTAVASRPRSETAPAVPGWTPLATPAATVPGVTPAIRTLVAGPREPDSWFAAVSGAGLWRSIDAGASWEPCPGLPAEVYAVRFVGGSNPSVAVATSDGCWVSADGGKTWADRSGGLDRARHLRALEIHPEDPAVMLAGAAPVASADGKPRRGTRFALYETSDGGASWTHVRRGFPDALEYDTITDIRFDPAAPEAAVVALDSGELWNTRNGGEWWEPLARQIRAARVLCAVG